MKIGFSYGRCVRDLVNGTVSYDDVLLIYAGTCIREREHVGPVMQSYGYQYDYLMGLDMDKCIEFAHRLWDDGKVVQPRVNGKSVKHIRESGVWMDLAPTMVDGQDNPLVQKAWRDYQMVLKISTTETLPEDQFRKRTEAEAAQLKADLDRLAGFI